MKIHVARQSDVNSVVIRLRARFAMTVFGPCTVRHAGLGKWKVKQTQLNHYLREIISLLILER